MKFILQGPKEWIKIGRVKGGVKDIAKKGDTVCIPPMKQVEA